MVYVTRSPYRHGKFVTYSLVYQPDPNFIGPNPIKLVSGCTLYNAIPCLYGLLGPNPIINPDHNANITLKTKRNNFKFREHNQQLE